jgi:hypothetical protein
MQLMTGTSDRRLALRAARLFHRTATLPEGQFLHTGNKFGVTHFRDYKGVPIFAIVKVSPICWNGGRLLYLSDRHQTDLQNPNALVMSAFSCRDKGA